MRNRNQEKLKYGAYKYIYYFRSKFRQIHV